VPSNEYALRPIGRIRTPHETVSDNVPIQGRMAPLSEGAVELFPEYAAGACDLEGFSHVFLLYRFHLGTDERLTVVPYMDIVPRGVFSTRFPHRPNRIGVTLVEVLGVDGTTVRVRGVDMVDGTPLLDIKPYVPRFDAVENAASVRTGWMTPYVNGGKEPDVVRTSSEADWLRERRSPGIVRRRILSNCGE